MSNPMLSDKEGFWKERKQTQSLRHIRSFIKSIDKKAPRVSN